MVAHSPSAAHMGTITCTLMVAVALVSSLLAVTVYMVVSLPSVGVPLMIPLAVSKYRPAGSAGEIA